MPPPSDPAPPRRRGRQRVPLSVPPGAQQLSAVPAHATAPFHGREPVPLGPAGPDRVVAVISPKGGCGKTTISLNLALSLARQGRRVVLLDTDANGDVLSAIDANTRAKFGFYDLLAGEGSLQQALLPTVLPGFKILPAVGHVLPEPDRLAVDLVRLRRLFSELAYEAEILIVDTPAGMFGVTQPIARASTHVLGVLQAEQIAGRSFRRFGQALEGIPPAERPAVLGVVVNMLQAKHEASLSVLQTASQDFPAEWLFDTSIPRHQAFLDASFAGVPLRHLNESAPPAVAWLFDTLAAEIAERLKLPEVTAQPQPLLL
jgi:chromosome partitioning protein